MKSEAEQRKNLLSQARKMGIDIEVQRILDRYDLLLKKATDPKERHQIAVMGLVELHKQMNCRGPLIVGGKEILPGDPGDEVAVSKNIVRISD